MSNTETLTPTHPDSTGPAETRLLRAHDSTSPRRGWTRRAVWLLLLALLPLYLFELGHGLPNRGVTWAIDGDPLVPLIFAKRCLLDGWNTGWHFSNYPNFHYFVLLMFQAPYMVLQYALGNLDGLKMSAGYPYGVEEFDSIYRHLGLITRFVSAMMALGTVYFVYRSGRALFPSTSAAVFAAAVAGLAPATVFYIHTEQLDVPMLFWLSVALFCYVRVLQTLQLRYYVFLAILAAVSTSTKYYAYGAFVLMPIPLVWHLAQSRPGGLTLKKIVRAIFDRRHGIAVAVFAVSFVLTENILWNPSGFMARVKLASGAVDGPITVTTQMGRFDVLSWERVEQLGRVMPFVLGWVGLAVCLAGLLSCALRQRQALAWLLWPLVGIYLFSVVPVLPAALDAPGGSIERPFMPMGLILAILGGHALSLLWPATQAGNGRKLACAAVVLLMALNAVAVDVLLARDPRYQTERWFQAHVAPHTDVEIYGYRSMGPRLYDHWDQKIVNQDAVPDDSDLQITGEEFLFAGLDQRSPELIIVCEPFARTWTRKQEHTELAPACNRFFTELDEEKLGYSRAARFEPFLNILFGMPEYRRLVPAITVYQRDRSS